jgi:hypothetical protein
MTTISCVGSVASDIHSRPFSAIHDHLSLAILGHDNHQLCRKRGFRHPFTAILSHSRPARLLPRGGVMGKYVSGNHGEKKGHLFLVSSPCSPRLPFFNPLVLLCLLTVSASHLLPFLHQISPK